MSDPILEYASPVDAATVAVVLDTVRALVVVMDVQGRIVQFNRTCEEVTGYTFAEVKGRPFWDIFLAPDERASVMEVFRRLSLEQVALYHVNHWLTRSGERRLIAWSNSVAFGPDGDLLSIIGTGIDITERQRERESLRRLEIAFEHAADGIAVVDSDLRIQFANPAWAALYGCQPGDQVDQSVSLLTHGNEGEWLGSALEKARDTGNFSGQVTLGRQDGTRRVTWLTVVLLRGPQGRPTGYVATQRDLSSQVRIEDALARQAHEILEISIPVVQVWEGVVAVPLIGCLDSQRSQRLMDQLLQKIADTGSPVALLDVTGVPIIDTQTAAHLVETAAAVRLLGAEVVLTGVRPAIARTLVHLGIDLSVITTRSDFAAGLRYALDRLGMDVTRRSSRPGRE